MPTSSSTPSSFVSAITTALQPAQSSQKISFPFESSCVITDFGLYMDRQWKSLVWSHESIISALYSLRSTSSSWCSSVQVTWSSSHKYCLCSNSCTLGLPLSLTILTCLLSYLNPESAIQSLTIGYLLSAQPPQVVIVADRCKTPYKTNELQCCWSANAVAKRASHIYN